MSDKIIIGGQNLAKSAQTNNTFSAKTTTALSKPTIEAIPSAFKTPNYDVLHTDFEIANKLVDDIVLKKYLHNLSDLEVVPLDPTFKNIQGIRIFKITEMVYQNNEYSTYKFATVFNALQNLNCGTFVIVDSDGIKTNFYMGIRTLDNKRTAKSLKDTLSNALSGHFPGVQTEQLTDPEAQDFLNKISTKNIASVSCIANNKDADFKDNDKFIQGLEKFALAMNGQQYTCVILAKSTTTEQLEFTRQSYETIYTNLSPFKQMQVSYGTNTAVTISNALSHGITSGTSHSVSSSTQVGTSTSTSETESYSESQQDQKSILLKKLGKTALGIAAFATAPLTGGASLVAAGGLMLGHKALDSIQPKTITNGHSTTSSKSNSTSQTSGITDTTNNSITDTTTDTRGTTTGTTDNTQLTKENKTITNILEKIDQQLDRLKECENSGMWECATYFLSDTQVTAEMAAGTYKAIMKGVNSGVETSAINFWGYSNHKEALPLLHDYITNFIHPIFKYKAKSIEVPVTASSLVTSNELAIQMGLPRKSVCGFPVTQHADFGQEVVRYEKKAKTRDISIGKIFTMGSSTKMDVKLDCDSLTMHTFVTGSTGSGKSNTIYEILNQVRNLYNIPFLVIEPAKGEYKNVFGQFPDVQVYGTNPQKAELLRINPFRFPKDIHILEHLDRLVEIFNVCWPMYAAMPAILKDAMERAYINTGWDLTSSQNLNGEIYPNFSDLQKQIEIVINTSKYSEEGKGDYSGALLTRVRSLTNGLNGLIFSSDDIPDEQIFDKNVIVDLSRIGSVETKSLIMGILVMKLSEYRMSSGKMNSPLSHITVLEEAHNILKRTSTQQSNESSNVLGKSVELLANSIAEMRTYGEGFIIADQSPALLDMSAIRNTNTKIILRLPDREDRELVGFSAALDNEQINELTKLKRGVAAVYQNDWINPVLVQINRCSIPEKIYSFTPKHTSINSRDLKLQLLNFLIQGRLDEKLRFSVADIEAGLSNLSLGTEELNIIKKQIEEYKINSKLSLWNDSNFSTLSKIVTSVLALQESTDLTVLNSKDLPQLTNQLKDNITQQLGALSEKQLITLSQCLMKNMSIQPSDSAKRTEIYQDWFKHMYDNIL